MLYPIGVFGRIGRCYSAIQYDAYFVSRRRIEMNLPNIAVEVAGRDIEESPAHVPMHQQSASVTPLALRIDVEHRLNEVIPRRQLRETVDRVTECGCVDDRGLTGLK